MKQSAFHHDVLFHSEETIQSGLQFQRDDGTDWKIDAIGGRFIPELPDFLFKTLHVYRMTGTNFVALGFEHSIANMYLIPIGMIADSGSIDWGGLFANLVPVTIGNVIGGGFVALVYWIIYLRGKGESF